LKNFSSVGFGRNPFNPKDAEYFMDRKLSNLFDKDSFRMSIYKRQHGICPICGSNLAAGDWDEPVHLHHLIPRSEGGKDLLTNLMLLHEECHYKIHKDGLSKADMLGMLYQQICKGTLVGVNFDGIDFKQKIKAFNSIIRDKDTWSVLDRVKAVSELSSLTSVRKFPIKLRKESLESLNTILTDPVAYPLLKSFYENKTSSISQQVILIEDNSINVT
jgi:hypothetical protein